MLCGFLPLCRQTSFVNTVAPLHAFGAERVTAAGDVLNFPAAQFGVQPFTCSVPLPVADDVPQLDQRRPVRYPFASPQ